VQPPSEIQLKVWRAQSKSWYAAGLAATSEKMVKPIAIIAFTLIFIVIDLYADGV
jgi:hypothetical protein